MKYRHPANIMATLAAVAFLASAAFAQSADSILQKTRDVYVQMASYADTGVVVYEYGASGEDRHAFSTGFSRSPRRLLLQFHKQGGDEYVIWGDPGAFHTWWKMTGQQTDYPNPNNTPAISMSGQPTAQVALKVPTLLFGKSNLAAAMLNLADPVLDGTEDFHGHRCYRVTGRASDTYAATQREVNVHKATVWIDADTYLVRQMLEEWKPLPGQRSRTTTIFDPQGNPKLDDAKLKFTPPSQ